MPQPRPAVRSAHPAPQGYREDDVRAPPQKRLRVEPDGHGKIGSKSDGP